MKKFIASLAQIDKRVIRSYLTRSWAISWPMTLIMLFEFLIGLTDIYIAGRLGKEVQATYGMVIQLYFIFMVLANALTVGTVSVVSRLFSAGEEKELSVAVSSSIRSATGIGIIIAGVAFLLGPAFLRVTNLPEALKPLAMPMIQIYAAGLCFHYLLINSNGILRSCNRITSSLGTMAIVCGLNIFLNFIFVFQTSLAYRGIALATACSVLAGSVINLIRLRSTLKPGRSFSISPVRRMMAIGWPVGLLQVLWLFSSMVLFFILSSLPENRVEIIAAFTNGLRIESAIYLPAFAFNLANAVIIGNFLGEKKAEDAFHAGIATASVGVGLVAIMALAVILNAWWIAPILSDNPVVIRESILYIYISMISEPFMAWGLILAGGLSGAGDTKSVLVRVALSLWLVRIPLSYAFVLLLGWGTTWVWWSMNFSQIIQAFLISRRYFKRGWL